MTALALVAAAPASAQGPIGDQQRISQTGTDGDANRDALGPRVAFNQQTSEFLSVWSADGGGTDNHVDVFGQRLSPPGAELLGDFRISHVTPDASTDRPAFQADVAGNSQTGEHLVVWEQDLLVGGGPADSSREIFAQLVAPDGTEKGGDIRISVTGADDTNQSYNGTIPQVAYNPAANEYLIVWSSTGAIPGNTKEEIVGQRMSAAGDKLGGQFRISHTRTDAEFSKTARIPKVAFNSAANEYLVVFFAEGDTENDTDVWGQRIDATGAEVGGDFRISTTDGADRRGEVPSVAYNSRQNEYLVVYQSDRLAIDNKIETFGQRLAADGSLLGGPARLSTVGPDDDPARGGLSPSVAYSFVGNEYLVVWRGDPAVDTDNEIWGQRVAADGSELGGDLQISSHGGDAANGTGAREPDVTYSTASNEYMAVWSADGLEGPDDELEIFSRRIQSGDTIDPVIVPSAKSTASARKRNVYLKLVCSEPCAVTAKATVTGLSKSFKLKTVKYTELIPFNQHEVRFTIPKSKLPAILARIRAKKKVLVKMSVRALDAFGNDGTATKNVRLK